MTREVGMVALEMVAELGPYVGLKDSQIGWLPGPSCKLGSRGSCIPSLVLICCQARWTHNAANGDHLHLRVWVAAGNPCRVQGGDPLCLLISNLQVASLDSPPALTPANRVSENTTVCNSCCSTSPCDTPKIPPTNYPESGHAWRHKKDKTKQIATDFSLDSFPFR